MSLLILRSKMDTLELVSCLQQTKFKNVFIIPPGVFASDQLPLIPHKNCCFIMNLDPISQPGSHWSALFFQDGNCDYFCSYALPPSERIRKFIRKNTGSAPRLNKTRLQDYFSTVCGEYCLYFLCNRAEGHSMREIVQSFTPVLSRNDGIVQKFVLKYFNKLNPTIDMELITRQIAIANKM